VILKRRRRRIGKIVVRLVGWCEWVDGFFFTPTPLYSDTLFYFILFYFIFSIYLSTRKLFLFLFLISLYAYNAYIVM